MSFLRDGNTILRPTLTSASFIVIILHLVRCGPPPFPAPGYSPSKFHGGNCRMVLFNLLHRWKCRSQLSMPFILPHRHLALFAMTRPAFSFLQTTPPAGVPIIRVSFLPHTKLRSLLTLTSFNLSCRHLAPHGYHAPFCLHQLQDFSLLFIRTFEIARCHLRLRHLSLFSSLSSRGSYCGPLPFITSGLLPTT